MADVYGCKPEVEPPPFHVIGVGPARFDDRDVALMAAVAKVASSNALCVTLNREMEAKGTDLTTSHPRCHALHMANTQRRIALVELSDTPATSGDACSAKLKVLMEMFVAYGREDPEMVDRLIEYAHEVTALVQRVEPEKRVMGSWRKTLTSSRSIRWIMSFAFAFSSAVVGRLNAGGLN